MDNDLILADQIDGIPHPGEAHDLFGHEDVISSLLEQYQSGRMHHAILLSGMKGIGKTSLALRMASHVFHYSISATAPIEASCLTNGNHIHPKVTAKSHPNLLHLTRPWDPKAKKFKTRLTVEEIRQTVHFFGTAKGESGWRVAIIDALDDMNASGSNALLKILEEPPEQTLFFVIAHSLGAVMPTIRSRCLHVPMKPLTEEQVLSALDRFGISSELTSEDRSLLGHLSEGSVRRAIILAQEDGLSLYKSFLQICSNLANPDWGEIQTLADGIVQRGKEDRYRLFLNFADNFLHGNACNRDASAGAISSLARWAEVWEKTQNSVRAAESYNLDRKQVILNLFHEIGEAARA